MKQLGPLGVFAIALVVAGLVPLVGSDYAVSFSIQLLIFLVLAYSWNLIGGYTGYTHFGQVAFFGIGAYVGSLLIFHWNVPWYLAALAAALAGAIVALPLGGAMLRLKGPFFAIGMFGLARVLEAFALGFDGITQGGTGIYLKPLGDLKPLYYVAAAVAAVMMLLTWRLDNSRLGLKLLAIREDENAAESLGIRPRASRSALSLRQPSRRRRWGACTRSISDSSIRRQHLRRTSNSPPLQWCC
jgi:branched-chain amino acid transport system permease protein